MKIIVLAHPKDDHAAPVRWALEHAGYLAACWSGVSWAEQEQASLLFDQPSAVNLGPYRLKEEDVVWLRQADRPGPDSVGSAADSERGRLTHGDLFNQVAYGLESLPVRCINRFSTSCMIRNKGVQLHLAAEAGLKIPATLMSNAPVAVRDFFDQHPHDAICKAFASHIWQQQGSEEIAVTETFALNRSQLPTEDEVFTYAPAIYQQMVPKEFDVRAVLMGESVYSFALRTPESSLDWRHDAALRKVNVETVATPVEVQDAILRFADKTGASFGSIDFAVDGNGDWWFLEINEQGQFLWLDQFIPEAGMLQKFCAFLTGAQDCRQSFEQRQHLFPSFAEYLQLDREEEIPDISKISPESLCKSVEP